MNPQAELALETTAELFLTAFNGAVAPHGALAKTESRNRPSEAADVRWFLQTFTGSANFELSAGISNETIAALPVDIAELLGTVFQSVARSLATVGGSGLVCGALTEEAPPPDSQEIVFELSGESESPGLVILAVSKSALSFLRRTIQKDRPPARHLDALMNIDLPVRISFGSSQMILSDVLKLTTGSIVEFNHLLNEPVNVLVNDCLVARGDVVVMDGNYGIRISEVVSQPTRV